MEAEGEAADGLASHARVGSGPRVQEEAHAFEVAARPGPRPTPTPCVWPSIVDGTSVRLEKAEASVLHLMAQETFRRRYAEIWPAEQPETDEDDG
jgi:hypothetical protein